MDSNPDLANKIADVIEQYVIEQNLGGGDMINQFDGVPPMNAPGAPGAPGAPSMPGMSGMGPMLGPMGGTTTMPGMVAPAGPTVPPDLLERINALEEGHANIALDRELANAKQQYEQLKNHFPILPDLNEKEILQIAFDNGGMPLNQALQLWAMQKLQEGEGTVADRITAATLNKSKANGLPAVEGKGGSIPSGEQAPPQSMKEARGRARDMLRALFAQPTG